MRTTRVGCTGPGCVLVAVVAAMIALPNSAAAQGPNQAALLGDVGAWKVAVWMQDGRVTYGLSRTNSHYLLRFWCLGDEEGWLWMTSMDPEYGWPRAENGRNGAVWASFNGGKDTLLDNKLVDTYGGVLRGFVVFHDRGGNLVPAHNVMFNSRTVSFRVDGHSATMTFDMAGLDDAHRLAYTVTGLCRPSGS